MLQEPGQKLTKMLIGSLHAENDGISLNKTVFPRNLHKKYYSKPHPMRVDIAQRVSFAKATKASVLC